VRLSIPHNGEDEDADIEDADAKELQIVSRSKGVNGQAGQVNITQDKDAKVDWYNLGEKISQN
jgi:hypothetical protein